MWVDESITQVGNGQVRVVPLSPEHLAGLSRRRERPKARGKARQNELETRTQMARVLVIDDHIDARVLLEDFLQSRGYYVSVAKNGNEALALLRGGLDFDLILLDLVMPESDGFQLIAALRTLPQPLRKVPVIVLSGAAPRTLRGTKAVLSKPIELDVLLKVIERVLGDS